jgi:hypothetical protein
MLTAVLLFFASSVQSQSPTVIQPLAGVIENAQPFGDGALIEFQWRRNGVVHEDYAVSVGRALGSWDIFKISQLRARYLESHPEIQSVKIGIPADGKQFFVRFWWRDQKQWSYEDIEYKAPQF